MASLNDVLKEVLEKDFDEKDVDKVVNPDGETTGDDRARTEAEAEQDDHGDSYVGPGDFVQNSVGRGAVESFIKNSVYEKYNIDASSMKSFARMTPTEMLSDFGKTVGDLGRIRSDYQAGKMTAAEYKSAMSHTRGEIVGKMLEMGSSRKSILEDVFLRSVGIGPEERSIHSFRDLVDAFREDEVDPVDTDLNPDAEMPEVEPDEMDINPDAEITPDTGKNSVLNEYLTNSLLVKGLPFEDACAFMNGYGADDQKKLYEYIGGCPLYLSLIDKNKTVDENINDLFLKRNGFIYNDIAMALQKELIGPAVYNSLLRAVAQGKQKAKEILEETGEERGKAHKYLNVLISMGILYREVPKGEDPLVSRKGTYHFEDNAYRFWYRYVLDNQK